MPFLAVFRMTNNEAKKLMAVMTVAFPNYKVADVELTAQTWAMMLADYTYEQVNDALKAYILSENKGFAPSIGQIVEKIIALSQPEAPTSLEAWSMVRLAARNSSYHATEEFAKLPAIVQKAVGSAGNLEEWAKTEQSQFETVIQSNFLRSYSAVLSRQRETQKLQGLPTASEPVYLPEMNLDV